MKVKDTYNELLTALNNKLQIDSNTYGYDQDVLKEVHYDFKWGVNLLSFNFDVRDLESTFYATINDDLPSNRMKNDVKELCEDFINNYHTEYEEHLKYN